MAETSPVVGVIMGSQSDWSTMRHTTETLEKLGIAHEAKIISAHRTPDRLTEYAEGARDRQEEGGGPDAEADGGADPQGPGGRAGPGHRGLIDARHIRRQQCNDERRA